MSTGYTDCIGKGADFKQFALGCARAFGALVTMRDEPSNVEIPDEFLPSDYHKKKIKIISRQLAKIRKLSVKECSELAKKEYNSEVKRYRKYIKENEDLAVNYHALKGCGFLLS